MLPGIYGCGLSAVHRKREIGETYDEVHLAPLRSRSQACRRGRRSDGHDRAHDENVALWCEEIGNGGSANGGVGKLMVVSGGEWAIVWYRTLAHEEFACN